MAEVSKRAGMASGADRAGRAPLGGDDAHASRWLDRVVDRTSGQAPSLGASRRGKKLGATKRAEAVRLAESAGLVPRL